MQNIAIHSRGVTRNLVTNVVNELNTRLTSPLTANSILQRLFTNIRFLASTNATHQKLQQTDASNTNSQITNSNLNNLRLVSAHAGFSKDLSKPLVKLGIIGDDAWFITQQKNTDVLGVADGVGGWREYGIDPSKFSSTLMNTCKFLIEQEKLNIQDANCKTPIHILSKSYKTLLDSKNSLIGSSTACIVIFNRDTEFIHAANLGDSGFVIIRNNKIVHRSQEQQHYFNSPFQLAIHPQMNADNQDSLISDRPESASTSSFKVAEGDFILVATDGLWDNLPEESLIHEISKIKSFLLEDLEKAAKLIAKKAIEIAFDPDFLSPFAQSARKNIGVNVNGGKPDDVTVLLARVSR